MRWGSSTAWAARMNSTPCWCWLRTSLVSSHSNGIGVDQGLPEVVAFAFDVAVEAVAGEVDAVVGDAVLREVVGTDAVAAVAAADLFLAQGGAFAFQARALGVVEPSAQPAQRLL